MDYARMSHYSNLQTHHSPEKAWRGGERGQALGVPTALARQCLPGSEPSECAHTPGPMACARVEGTRRKKRAWQARRRGLPRAPGPPCADERVQAAGVPRRERPSPEEARKGDVPAWAAEGSTNRERLVSQVCRTEVNGHQDHWRLRLPPATAALTQPPLASGPGLGASSCLRELTRTSSTPRAHFAGLFYRMHTVEPQGSRPPACRESRSLDH